MLVRLEHPRKASWYMLVTEFGIIVFLQPAISVFDAVSIIALQLLRESYLLFPDDTVILERLGQ